MTAPDISAFSKEVQENLRKVDFGLQVQAFLKSKIGVFLLERANNEVQDNTDKLKNFDIMRDPAGATRLQMEIRSAENVLYWLAEAVREGALMIEQMMAEERQAVGIGGADQGDPTGL